MEDFDNSALGLSAPGSTRKRDVVLLVVNAIFITFGFLGNTLSFLVTVKTDLKQLSTAVYLTTLAVTDNIVLLVTAMVHTILESNLVLGASVKSVHSALCLGISFLQYWVPQLSSWCLVAITLERTLAVLLPHRSVSRKSSVLKTNHRICTPWFHICLQLAVEKVHQNMLGVFRSGILLTRRTAWATVGIFATIFALLNTHVFTAEMATVSTSNDTTARMCVVKEEHAHTISNFVVWFDMTMYTILPSLLIVFFNSVTMCSLAKALTRRKKMTTKRTPDHAQIAPMLVLVSTFFVVTTLPISIHNLGQ